MTYFHIFDGDETCWEDAISYQKWVVDIVGPVCKEFLGRVLSAKEWEAIIHNGMRRQYLEERGVNYLDFWKEVDRRDYRMREILLKNGSIHVPNDVYVLKYLNGRKTLVSNGPTKSMQLMVKSLNLAQYFEIVQGRILEKIDEIKPKTYLFEITCRRMGVKPEDTVFVVGDNNIDVLAANNFKRKHEKTQSVYINRSGEKHPDADINISSLTQLLELLKP
jgi:HAD superfamily hydrolase (TIGR01549 family)